MWKIFSSKKYHLRYNNGDRKRIDEEDQIPTRDLVT